MTERLLAEVAVAGAFGLSLVDVRGLTLIEWQVLVEHLSERQGGAL